MIFNSHPAKQSKPSCQWPYVRAFATSHFFLRCNSYFNRNIKMFKKHPISLGVRCWNLHLFHLELAFPHVWKMWHFFSEALFLALIRQHRMSMWTLPPAATAGCSIWADAWFDSWAVLFFLCEISLWQSCTPNNLMLQPFENKGKENAFSISSDLQWSRSWNELFLNWPAMNFVQSDLQWILITWLNCLIWPALNS